MHLFERCGAIALACLLLAATAIPALAAPFEDAVAKLTTDDFSDTGDAVAEIASSGNPQAGPIISALQDGRLLFDADSKKVYVTGADGSVTDAATGQPVASVPSSATAVRLNNRLRRQVETALGGLDLVSPDPAKRVLAAESVFKSHDVAMLPTVETVLAKETDKAARQAFTEARAAIIL